MKLSFAFSFNFFGTESVVICDELNPFSESGNGICKETYCCFMIPVPGDLLYKFWCIYYNLKRNDIPAISGCTFHKSFLKLLGIGLS